MIRQRTSVTNTIYHRCFSVHELRQESFDILLAFYLVVNLSLCSATFCFQPHFSVFQAKSLNYYVYPRDTLLRLLRDQGFHLHSSHITSVIPETSLTPLLLPRRCSIFPLSSGLLTISGHAVYFQGCRLRLCGVVSWFYVTYWMSCISIFGKRLIIKHMRDGRLPAFARHGYD